VWPVQPVRNLTVCDCLDFLLVWIGEICSARYIVFLKCVLIVECLRLSLKIGEIEHAADN
jgi:hypothetical protein